MFFFIINYLKQKCLGQILDLLKKKFGSSILNNIYLCQQKKTNKVNIKQLHHHHFHTSTQASWK